MVSIVGKDESAVKQVTCLSCASILRYTPSEEKRDYTSDYTGGTDYYNYITCPCCAKRVTTRGY